MAARLKWEEKASGLLVAFVKKSRVSVAGKAFKALEALRVMKKGEGCYELSMAGAISGCWMPWEQLGEPSYPSLAAAKKFAAKKFAAAYAGAAPSSAGVWAGSPAAVAA